MKKLIILLNLVAFQSIAFCQIELPNSKWQEDLRYLQDKVHNEYSFLFVKVSKDEFDREVEKFHEKIPGLSEHQIVVGFAKIVSLFKYGHTTILLSEMSEQIRYLPINIYQFSDGIYIQGVHKDYKETLGAKVIEVEDVSIADALEAIRPTVSVENNQFFISYGIANVTSPEILHTQGITDRLKDEITLTLLKDNETFKVSLKARKRPPLKFGLVVENDDWLDVRKKESIPLYLRDLDKNYFFEYLSQSRILYVRQSQQLDDKTETIAKFYDKVYRFIESNQVDKFVIDVRLNSGGNNFKNKPIVIGAIQAKEINKRGRFFVITGRRTFSACQNLVNELENYTDALFFGEPTAENLNFYGDVHEEILPNSKMAVYLSFAWWQDKPSWRNDDWLAPDLFVQISFDDYVNGRDPILDEIINFSEDEFVFNPEKYLRSNYLADKDKFRSTASQLKGDIRYQFINVESEINELGYHFLEEEDIESALDIFTINANLYPNSANAWDSLGEGYWFAADIDNAVKSYEKAILLDPTGSVGENSREMLRRIAEEIKN